MVLADKQLLDLVKSELAVVRVLILNLFLLEDAQVGVELAFLDGVQTFLFFVEKIHLLWG